MKKTKQERKEEALKEYEKIRYLAYKEYDKIRGQAQKVYKSIEIPAYKKYKQKCKQIDEADEK